MKGYVTWLYKEAEIKTKNPFIVICESPMAMQLAINVIMSEQFAKALKKIGVENSVGNSVWNSVGNSVGNSVRNSVRNSVGNSVWNSERTA